MDTTPLDDPLFNDSGLPPPLMDRVRSELRDGERLLWVGQSRPGRLARQQIPLVVLGIPWTAIALLLTAAASGVLVGGFNKNGWPISFCFSLIGVPFVLVGLAMLSSPYWAARAARRSCYALTDRRAIVWKAGSTFGGLEVRSYGPGELGAMFRIDYGDGVGDLILHEIERVRIYKGRERADVTRYGFEAIPDVKRVETLVRRALVDQPGPE